MKLLATSRGVRSVIIAGVAFAAACAPSLAWAQEPFNRLANPSAEDPAGLTGWLGAGWTTVAYGAAPRYPPTAPCCAAGSRLFAAVANGERISQTVDLSDVAAQIDAGGTSFSFRGRFGAQGGTPDSARLVVTLHDGGGAQVGPVLTVGAPTDRDRGGQTTLLTCQTAAPAPPGTRSARVTLEAVGPAGPSTAMAEELYATTGYSGFPPIGVPPADGEGCYAPARGASPPVTGSGPSPPPPARPVPRLSSLLSLPAADRCGRPAALRFRVRPQWRSRVARLEVTARGRSRSRDPRKNNGALTLAGPRGSSLLVRLSVVLADGRRREGQRRYAGCAGR